MRACRGNCLDATEGVPPVGLHTDRNRCDEFLLGNNPHIFEPAHGKRFPPINLLCTLNVKRMNTGLARLRTFFSPGPGRF